MTSVLVVFRQLRTCAECQVTGSPLHSCLLNEKEMYPTRHSKGLHQRSQAQAQAQAQAPSRTGSLCASQTGSGEFVRQISELLVPAGGHRRASFRTQISSLNRNLSSLGNPLLSCFLAW